MDSYEELYNNDNCLIVLKIQHRQNKKDYKVYDLTEEVSTKNIKVLASTNHGNAFVLYFKFPTNLPKWFEDMDFITCSINYETILKLFGYPIDRFSAFVAISLCPHSFSFFSYDGHKITSQDVDYWEKRLHLKSAGNKKRERKK